MKNSLLALSILFLLFLLSSCSHMNKSLSNENLGFREIASKSGSNQKADSCLDKHGNDLCKRGEVLKILSEVPHMKLGEEFELTGPEFRAQVDVIKKIDSYLSQYLNKPSFTFDSPRRGTEAYWSIIDNTIKAPYIITFESENGKAMSKHPIFSRAVLAHEYSHAYFFFNLRPTVGYDKTLEESFSILKQQFERVESSAKKLVAECMEKNQSENDCYNLPEYENLLAECSQIEKAFFNMIENDKKEVVIGANELFADAGAYFFTNNPEAIKDLLYYTDQMKELKNMARMRSFTTKLSVTLAQWRKEDIGLKSNVVGTDIYQVFNPTRNYLFENYLSRPQFKKDPGRSMSALLLTFEKFIQYIISNERTYLNMTIDDANKELQGYIDLYLPKYFETIEKKESL